MPKAGKTDLTSPRKIEMLRSSLFCAALLALAVSVAARKQALLQTELTDVDVVTKSGQQIPTSQLFKTGEPIDKFPSPSDGVHSLRAL